jgi:hypothetical protein
MHVAYLGQKGNKSYVIVFCIDKIQGGQDRAFLFRCNLVNYKAH